MTSREIALKLVTGETINRKDIRSLNLLLIELQVIEYDCKIVIQQIKKAIKNKT